MRISHRTMGSCTAECHGRLFGRVGMVIQAESVHLKPHSHTRSEGILPAPFWSLNLENLLTLCWRKGSHF